MEQDSDASDDIDYEELSAPSSPPEKPPNKIMFYVDSNRHRGISDEELRKEFNEALGKKERQKWTRRHNRAKKKYQALLKLYADANPGFNMEEYNNSRTGSSASQRGGGGKSSSSGRKRKRGDTYDSRAAYVGIETYGMEEDDDYNNSNNVRSSPSSNRKRVRRVDGGGAAPQQQTAASSSSIEELFKEINSGSKRVARNPDKFEPTDEDRAEMQHLVQKMRDAAYKDWQCNLQKKPAINTSQMLEVVVPELSKKLFYKYYLDDTDILEAIRDWIHPLPDGSLPAQRIRTELYRIIQKFALHEYDQASLSSYFSTSDEKARDAQYAIDIHPNLKSFAKTVMNLWAHKKETNGNKVLLRKIIEKWIRTLTGADASYGDLQDDMRENRQAIQQRYQMLQKQKRDFANFGGAQKRKRAQIPEKAWHDFAIAPHSVVTEDDVKNVFGNRAHPLQERMNKTFKRSANAGSSSRHQAAKPSVTGRRKL